MNEHYPFQAKPLPYLYDFLEPCISMETLHFHHDKHYVTYVDNLNKTLKEYPQYHNMDIEQLIITIPYMPKAIQTPIANNAGGVYNHQFYFNSMTRESGQKPSPTMNTLFINDYGSYENWKSLMTDAGMGVFGSGWVWLVQNRISKRIVIQTTPNQITPDLTKDVPLLLIDVWEHAYYLQYQNLRINYIKCWFNLIDWNKVQPI